MCDLALPPNEPSPRGHGERRDGNSFAEPWHPQDLAGPFTQYSFSAGLGDALSVHLSVGQNSRGEGVYNLSISPKDFPIGAGAGLSASANNTKTCVVGTFDIVSETTRELPAWPLTLLGIDQLPRIIPW